MLRVRVPATSANLGPGLDALGLALGLYLEVEGEPADVDAFDYAGDGQVANDVDNLVHRAFRAAFERSGRRAPPFSFRVRNPIPLARGLGSSAAAVVAGAALADEASAGALGRDGVFAVAATLEGHPDNVGPATYGGLTVAAERVGGGYDTASLRVPERWRFLFGVPADELPTARSRDALPERVVRADAVRTAARAGLWVAAVARDEPALVRTASLDVLHEPYRETLVPGLAATRTALLAAGADGAFLSGAGPTVGALVPPSAAEACREILARFAGAGGTVLELRAAPGYEVTSAARPAP